MKTSLLALTLVVCACSVDGTPAWPQGYNQCYLACPSIAGCTAEAARACSGLTSPLCEQQQGCIWASPADAYRSPPTVDGVLECLDSTSFSLCRLP